MRSWIILWILLLPSSDAEGVANSKKNLIPCTTGKFYANGVKITDYKTKEIDAAETRCILSIHMAVICDVKTATLTGEVPPRYGQNLIEDQCTIKWKNTISCVCRKSHNCNANQLAIINMLGDSLILDNTETGQILKDCAFKVLQEAFNFSVTATEATTIQPTSAVPPPEIKGKLSYDEIFAKFKPKEEDKSKHTRNYRDLKGRTSLIYLYCFALMTLIIIWQIRRYLVDRFDLQSGLFLWFEKTKEMRWEERFRASNRDYRREYTRAGEQYWTEVKKREKMAQKIRIAEWKDRYERSGECNWVDGDGHPPDKLYTSEAIEQRAHEWAVREERVTLLIQETDADIVAAIEAQEKARKEDKRQRDQLLSKIVQSEEMVKRRHPRRRRNK